ncbi:MAG: hypothetical protein AAB337_01405 [Patescibacteria group bacterium]
MFKKIFLIGALFVLPLVAPLTVRAIDITDIETELTTVGDAGYGTSGGPQSLTTTIGTIISTVLGLLGIIFLILAVYAGFLWMTSQGSEEKVKKAQQILTSSIIGLIITLAAYAIADFIVGEALTATGVT